MSTRLLFWGCLAVFGWTVDVYAEPSVKPEIQDLQKICKQALEASVKVAQRPKQDWSLDGQALCQQALLKPSCKSVNGTPIYHFEQASHETSGMSRILAIGLTHGDEGESGAVAFAWADRLRSIMSRSQWRVIPVLNPDGFGNKSRLNARGVDLNRNFPTADWSVSALTHWKEKAKADPRRYPGPGGASEPETQCAMQHIAEFKPDFIISVHTPYGVMDFDGPKTASFPKAVLPWVSLGHFPGSLGRYMWHDQNLPVLTIELNSGALDKGLEGIYDLQDISGTLALRSRLAESKKRPSL